MKKTNKSTDLCPHGLLECCPPCHWYYDGDKPMPDPERSFSHSAISSFEWNPEQWYQKYVLHKDCTYDKPSEGIVAYCCVSGFADPECPVVKKTIELSFGSMIDLKIQEDPTFIPELPRYELLQEKLRTRFHGIELVNIPDGLEYKPKVRVLDYKTGRNKWDKKRADETKQFTMAALNLWLIKGIRPEDIEFKIYWLPTHTKNGQVELLPSPEGKPYMIKVFVTKRTMSQVMEYGQYIIDVRAKMYEYALDHPVLETSDWSQW